MKKIFLAGLTILWFGLPAASQTAPANAEKIKKDISLFTPGEKARYEELKRTDKTGAAKFRVTRTFYREFIKAELRNLPDEPVGYDEQYLSESEVKEINRRLAEQASFQFEKASSGFQQKRS